MSIREVARELYRLEKETEKIEKMLEAAGSEEKERLKLQLRKIKIERDKARNMLEAMKKYPVQRKLR